MSKRIITISRQGGSGGHTIGQEVAKRLGISFYDKKLIDIVSERSGLSKETMETTDLTEGLAFYDEEMEECACGYKRPGGLGVCRGVYGRRHIRNGHKKARRF